MFEVFCEGYAIVLFCGFCSDFKHWLNGRTNSDQLNFVSRRLWWLPTIIYKPLFWLNGRTNSDQLNFLSRRLWWLPTTIYKVLFWVRLIILINWISFSGAMIASDNYIQYMTQWMYFVLRRGYAQNFRELEKYDLECVWTQLFYEGDLAKTMQTWQNPWISVDFRCKFPFCNQ